MKIKFKPLSRPMSDGLGEMPSMKKGMPMKGRMSVAQAFHEVKKNPPAILKRTARKFGKARAGKQRIAIAMSKARKSGD